MNALPTATACALPHGQAHGLPRATRKGSVAGTVHAKRSEVKGPEVKTPDLNGPEVKMNQPCSPLHHGVQIETREATPIVAPSPVTTPDAMMSLAAIEHLDFEPEVPCGHSQHASGRYGHHGPGWALVELDCPCGRGGRYVACRSWWLLLCSSGRAPRCGICGTRATVGVTLRIVRVLR